MPVTIELRAADHESHRLHAQDRLWPETNCYVDLWIELLHAVGAEPLAALGFLASCDFDGEQWDFFKFPLEDLRTAYGIEVSEFNVWRPMEDHVVEHLRLGHLLTMECDAMFLPDTEGVSYQIEHQKTTIAPISVDPAARRLEYFHNSGCFELSGADYDGALRSSSPWTPYSERIKVDALIRRDDVDLQAIARDLLATHLDRRPRSNPVERMAGRVALDTPWLRESSSETFHRYAFGTLRQCGAWAELMADFVQWLEPTGFAVCAAAMRGLSAASKTCQFKLARVANGRDADLSGLFDTMAAHWDAAYEVLVGAS